MDPATLQALRNRRRETLARWEDLLRIERVNTPLANPDALVHLFDWTLEEVFSRLAGSAAARAEEDAEAAGSGPVECECGRNPFVAYFKAARQALLEALVMVQAQRPLLDPIDRDLATAELKQVVDTLARTETASFCALCPQRTGFRPTIEAEP